MRLQDITQSLAEHGDTRAIVLHTGEAHTTTARAILGHRFRTEGAKELHRKTIDTFLSTVREELGETCATQAKHLLANLRVQGKPLRKYVVMDILHVLEGERLRINAYNDSIAQVDSLYAHIAALPEVDTLPPGLLGLSTHRTKDLLHVLWKNWNKPISPSFITQLAKPVCAACHRVAIAERLAQSVSQPDSPTGKLLAQAFATLQDTYALPDATMEIVRPHVCTLFTQYAWNAAPEHTEECTEESLLAALVDEELPGIKTLLNLLSPQPTTALDPLLDAYPLPASQAAWLDAAFAKPGIARTLAFMHGAAIFAHVPANSPPLPSDIWQGIFGVYDPSLNIFADKLEASIKKAFSKKMEEDGLRLLHDHSHSPTAQPEDAKPYIDTDRAMDLYTLGLSYESALRIANGQILVGSQDYDTPRLPFRAAQLSLLQQNSEHLLEQAVGNHFTASDITFQLSDSRVEIPIYGTQSRGNDHFSRTLPLPASEPVAATLQMTERLCPDTPPQRQCLLLLLGAYGTRPLQELSASCGTALNEQAGSTVHVHRAGENIVVQHSIHVLHPSTRKHITASLEYSITPDGSYTMNKIFFAHTPIANSNDVLQAYLESKIFMDDLTSKFFEGGLPGTLAKLQQEYSLDAEHLPDIEAFIRQALPMDFPQSTSPVPVRDIHEYIMNLKLLGLKELLYACGAAIPSSPSFTAPQVHSWYSAIAPTDKAWFSRLLPQGLAHTVGMRHMDAIKAASVQAPPFSPEAYWKGVFGGALPDIPKGTPFHLFVHEYIDGLFTHKLAGQEDIVQISPTQGTSRALLKDIFILSGMHMEAAMDCAVTPRGVHRQDFATLPTLCSLVDLPSEYQCIINLTQDIYRRGAESDPSITFHDTVTGSHVLYPQRSASMSAEGWAALQNSNSNNPIMLGIIQHVENMCSDNEAQKRALYLALGQRGLYPFRNLSKTASITQTLNEHTGCDISITRDEYGTLRVDISTEKNNPVDGHIVWTINPQGLGICEDLSLALRTPAQQNRGPENGSAVSTSPSSTPLQNSEILSAYCAGTLRMANTTDNSVNGLPDTLSMLATRWNVPLQHLPVVDDFIRKALPLDFADTDKKLNLLSLHNYIYTLQLKGLPELLHSLGVLIKSSVTFSSANTLSSYSTVSPTDKAWLARLAPQGVALALGLQYMESINAVSAAPFTPATYWEGVIGTELPADLGITTLEGHVRDSIDALFMQKLADKPETIALIGGGELHKAHLKDIFIVSGMGIEAAMDTAIHSNGITRDAFVALPMLYSLADAPEEHLCITQLAREISRFGVDSDPSITFKNTPTDSQTLYPQRQFTMSTDEWEAVQNGNINNPIMRGITRHVGNICNGSPLQRRALYIALGQQGLLPFHQLSRGTSLEHRLTERTGYDISVEKASNGCISVTIDTAKNTPLTGHIQWIIAPDGLAQCVDLSFLPIDAEKRQKKTVHFATSRRQSISQSLGTE